MFVVNWVTTQCERALSSLLQSSVHVLFMDKIAYAPAVMHPWISTERHCILWVKYAPLSNSYKNRLPSAIVIIHWKSRDQGKCVKDVFVRVFYIFWKLLNLFDDEYLLFFGCHAYAWLWQEILTFNCGINVLLFSLFLFFEH